MTISTLVTLIIICCVISLSTARNIGKEINEYFDYDTPLQGDKRCSLISIVMDESGSMAGEQAFMKNIAIPKILIQLKHADVDNVFVCSHGFGSAKHDPWGLDRGHFHGCTEGTAQGVVDPSIMDSWVTDGRYEDGWQAIHYAIRDLPSEINGKILSQTCKTMGRNIIVVTDEARYDNSCDGHLLQFEFKTDEFGSETSWRLEDSAGEIIAEDSGFGANQVVRVTKCLERNENYRLVFEDSYMDGFCCDYGQGYIKVWYDDNLIADLLANFQGSACIMIPSGEITCDDQPRISSVEQRQERKLISETNYFSLDNTKQKLLDTGYRLTAITIISMYGLQLDTPALGISSDSILFQPDAFDSYVKNDDHIAHAPMDLVDPNQMATDYASIAFETGGDAWLLHSLREGGKKAESFAQAFSDINAHQFEEDAFTTLSPSSSPSTSPSATMSPSASPSLHPSSSPTTSQPSEEPTEEPTVSTALPSEQPTMLPTESTTEVFADSIFDGRIEAQEPTDSSRTLVGFITGGLLIGVAVAFVVNRKQKETKVLEEAKKEGRLHPRERLDTDLESLDDSEVPSGSPESPAEDERFSLTGLAKCMEYVSSFRWDYDQDHMVDLCELAGEYDGGFQEEYGEAYAGEYDEGEYDE